MAFCSNHIFVHIIPEQRDSKSDHLRCQLWRERSASLLSCLSGQHGFQVGFSYCPVVLVILKISFVENRLPCVSPNISMHSENV